MTTSMASDDNSGPGSHSSGPGNSPTTTMTTRAATAATAATIAEAPRVRQTMPGRPDCRVRDHELEARRGEGRSDREDGRARAREAPCGAGGAARGLHPHLLRRRSGRRPAGAQRRRPLRRRARAPELRRPARAGRGEGARLHAAARGARLVVDPHGGRDRQRRHAVPRRLGEHGAQPARERRAPDHPSGRAGPPRRGGAAARGPPARRARRRTARSSPSSTPRSSARPTRSTSGQVRGGLERVLGDVRAAVEDWRTMVERGARDRRRPRREPAPVDEEELAETKALLEWIVDDHFTFLGYHEYDLVTEDGEERAPPRPGHRARHPARQRPRPGARQAPARGPGESRARRTRSSSPRRTPGPPCTGPRTSTTSA